MSEPSSNLPHGVIAPEARHAHSLVIRIWPNIPILYPMAIAALICGILSIFLSFDGELQRFAQLPTAPVVSGEVGAVAPAAALHTVDPAEFAPRLRAAQVIALVFLAAFTYSLVVVCTDIVLTGALIGVFAAVIVGLLLFILNIYRPFAPGLFGFLTKFTPVANSHFYFAVAALWGVLMIASMIYSRFHYVKIESNEVVMVGGVLDKRKRYSSMRMQYTKEVCDVFEYYLPFVRSGRLILRFPQEAEPVIIDHVMQIDDVVRRLDHITASLQVAPEMHDSEAA